MYYLDYENIGCQVCKEGVPHSFLKIQSKKQYLFDLYFDIGIDTKLLIVIACNSDYAANIINGMDIGIDIDTNPSTGKYSWLISSLSTYVQKFY